MILPTGTEISWEVSGTGWQFRQEDLYDGTTTELQDEPTFSADAHGNPFETGKYYAFTYVNAYLGERTSVYYFDELGRPVLVGGTPGQGSPAPGNTIGGYDGLFNNPQSGQVVTFFTLPGGKVVLINTTPAIPTLDQVARQEYTQNTNDSDGLYVPVLENGIYRLPRVMGWTRALQYLLTFATSELLSGLSFQIRPYLQSLADRGAYFEKLALTGFQYADAGSRQLDIVLAEENGQFVIRALTPAESGQRILSQLPPAQLAAIVAPYLSGSDQSLRQVVKRCEVLVPVPAPTSQKIMLSGASDGQVIPHGLETDQIEFGGAYSLNGANVYQLDTTVAITDPTATNVKLLTANPFTGYIRLRNATV